MNKNKIAIWVEGGAIQGIRSTVDIEVEIIDVDFDIEKEEAEKTWDRYQTELPFGIY